MLNKSSKEQTAPTLFHDAFHWVCVAPNGGYHKHQESSTSIAPPPRYPRNHSLQWCPVPKRKARYRSFPQVVSHGAPDLKKHKQTSQVHFGLSSPTQQHPPSFPPNLKPPIDQPKGLVPPSSKISLPLDQTYLYYNHVHQCKAVIMLQQHFQ
jgi:hypothetical protein